MNDGLTRCKRDALPAELTALLTKTNKNGIPDILAIPPNSNVIFSEIKTKRGKLSSLRGNDSRWIR